MPELAAGTVSTHSLSSRSLMAHAPACSRPACAPTHLRDGGGAKKRLAFYLYANLLFLSCGDYVNTL